MSSIQHRVVARWIGRTRGRAYRSAEALQHKIAEQRRTRTFTPPAALGRRCDVVRRDAHGRPCFLVRPRTGGTGTRLLYLHGGGFVFEMTSRHWAVVGQLARATGATVTVPIFGLAPEHTCADALPPLVELYREMRADPRPLVVVGDSTGATLAVATVRAAGHAPDRLVLISPLADLGLAGQAVRELDARDPWLSVAGLRAAAGWWSGPLGPDDPRVSPLHGAPDGIGPTTLVVGTRDLCHPGAVALRDRLVAAGVPVDWTEGRDLIHVYPLLPVPEGRAALSGIARQIRALS